MVNLDEMDQKDKEVWSIISLINNAMIWKFNLFAICFLIDWYLDRNNFDTGLILEIGEKITPEKGDKGELGYPGL